MYQNSMRRKILALFICILCLIGCRKTNIRKVDIIKTEIRETDTKNYIDKQRNLYDEMGTVTSISDIHDEKMTASEKNSIKKTGIIKTEIGEIDTKNYNEKQSKLYDEMGAASFISDVYDGKMTASGIRYDRNKMTAAHPSLPFDTKILITNLRNNRMVEVIVIDRFLPTKDRIVNVSHRAAVELDLTESGVAKVGIKIIAKPE